MASCLSLSLGLINNQQNGLTWWEDSYLCLPDYQHKVEYHALEKLDHLHQLQKIELNPSDVVSVDRMWIE